IKSKKIDITNKEWIIKNAEIYIKNNKEIVSELRFNTNFDYEILGKNLEARQQYQEALRLDPTDTVVQEALMRVQ
ncbi:MAG: hypothetical protein ACPHL6_03525, partial [Rubripirellula sp.]